MASDIVKDTKFQLFVALVTTTPFILYFVGRWYKEWYFAQFRVQYGMLRSDVLYYEFGSWATMLVAVTSIAIGLNVWLRLTLPSSLFARIVAIVLFVLALVRVFVLKLQFNPNQLFVTKLLTSADLSIVCLGLGALVHAILSDDVRRVVSEMFTRLLIVSPIMWWVGLFVFWTYCAGIGYALGTYHGQKAIWEGKMGLQWVTIKGENRRWILVEQADDNRVFVFDRDREVSRFVKRDDIEEMQERVSP